MSEPQAKRGILLELAAEGIVPVLGGCAGVLVAGPEGGVAGAMVAQVVEKAINFFGGRIVERWNAWFRVQPVEKQVEALAELAALPPDEARQQASDILISLAPDADADDLSIALEYLSAIPRTVDRAMLKDSHGVRSMPPTISLAEPQALMQLLPADVPPYPVPSDLPGTPYRLTALLGSGGFGAVYKAGATTLQHLPLAIKFCLDRALLASLQHERANLERLMKAGGEGWAKRIVRLYGYDLDHRSPYLVYEFVPGGDLLHHLGKLRRDRGRNLTADEVYEIIRQIADALAFAHGHGLVHRDLKPANILVDGDTLKLADFGLGGVMAVRAAAASQMGKTTVSLLTAAEQASLFRGAGTPLYMAPEQRRGCAPDPRHDLYSLGVIWYQLLVGDTTRELHAGWAKELVTRYQVPKEHIELIERCVGWFDDRPKDARELLGLLGDGKATAVVAPPAPPTAELVSPVASMPLLRRQRLRGLIEQIDRCHTVLARLPSAVGFPMRSLVWAGVAFAPFVLAQVILALLKTSGYELAGPGFMVALGVGVVNWVVRTRTIARTRQELSSLIATTAREFADEVAAWGGRNVLEEPASVNSILRDLSDSPAVSVPAAGDESSLVRGRLLASMMGSLAAALRALEKREVVPAVRIFVVAQVVGWAAGWGVAALAFKFWNPGSRLFGYMDENVLNIGAAVGLMAFLAAVAGQFLLWRWQLDQARQAAAALAVDLAAEFPDVIPAVGGEAALADLGAVEQIQKRLMTVQGPALRQEAVRILLDRLAALLRERQTKSPPVLVIVAVSVPIAYIMGHLFGETIYTNLHRGDGFFNAFRSSTFEIGGVLGGIAMGLVWLAALVAAQVWMWRRQRDRLNAQAQRLQAALEGPFAAEVRSWGGPAILRDANTVAEMSRSLVGEKK
jgi:hypothetical protein